MKKNILTSINLILITVYFLNAQVPDPVKWNFSSEVKNEVIELIFTAEIEQPWYMYGTDFPEGGPIPTSLIFNESNKFELLGDVEELTKSIKKYDEIFEINVTYFKKKAILKQIIKPLTDEAFEVLGSIEFMCCNNTQCLPPDDEEFTFKFNAAIAETQKSGDIKIVEKDNIKATIIESQDEIVTNKNESTSENANPLEDKSLLGIFIVAFLAGIAGLLTPCVYPMIPMTISFFIRDSKNRLRAIAKALVFGLSILAIYTSIGIIVSLLGKGDEFASYVSTHWIPNLLFFLLFVVFAASFFGLFEIVLPSSLANKVDKQADKGGYLGSFFMALALVIVSFSCTGPIVASILAEAAKGAVLAPSVGMFGYGLAFALPFTFFAISPSLMEKLPKSGGWLNSVKVVIAFVLLLFSLKFISTINEIYHLNILSRDLFIAIWIVLFILMGFYLLGKIKFSHDSDIKYIGVFRLLLVIISFSFAVYLIPGLFGAPLKPLSGLLPPITSQQFDVSSKSTFVDNNRVIEKNVLCEEPKYADFLHLPHGLKGYFDYEQGMACAKEMNKPVLLDFKGHSCAKCKEMEEKVWSDPRILNRLKDNYIIIALYADDRTKLTENEWITSSIDGKVKKTIGKKNKDLQITKYGILAQPYYVLVDNGGNSLVDPMAYDLDIDNFIDFLDRGIEKYKSKKPTILDQMVFEN